MVDMYDIIIFSLYSNFRISKLLILCGIETLSNAKKCDECRNFYLQVIFPACDVINRPHFQRLKCLFAAVHVGMRIFVAAMHAGMCMCDPWHCRKQF
jgi:hypothetical protein